MWLEIESTCFTDFKDGGRLRGGGGGHEPRNVEDLQKLVKARICIDHFLLELPEESKALPTPIRPVLDL